MKRGSLNVEQVKHVAKLASLPLTEEELSTYSDQLGKILDYFDQLNQVDTDGVEPTFNVTGQENVFRKDSSGDTLSQEKALRNANITKEGYFVTKGVFED